VAECEGILQKNGGVAGTLRLSDTSMFTRRELLKLGVFTLAATHFPRSIFAEKISTKKILILGGTGFLGPAVVERALQRGHAVTLFNRGKTNADLFPSVEKIRGDREKGDLSGLEGSRQWDAVIDVWATEPAMVMASAKLLVDRTQFYFFVSSIAAYANYSKINMDEAGPTRLDRPGYGGDKARSEKFLEEIFAGRAGIARPCAIIGPRNDGLAYHFWLSRLARDEQIVAPGSGDDAFVEYVDVRDVANWTVDSGEKRRPGIYNLCSLPTPFRVFLNESSRGIGGKAKLVWVNGDFLRNEQHVGTFNNMPFWNPDRLGFDQISSAKARAAGFSERPLSESSRDSWAWYQKIVSPNIVYPQKQDGLEWGISRDRERKILVAWNERQSRMRVMPAGS
jgi:2'-hydroxyisoflavone reductase